ncbi:glutamate--cysteine ligase [Kitasatospora sp. RB6PN24]|uniref:carboxylate-amine ligase n=1 Tax=Kitasatospora humi TaxID=2893891 RepID=UPI001E568645|nr:glutamate--cysteine ligase [Kitasatospora humi]MCC9305744.1 glutamate--cysteine ligase [Kitasatospora humi]
MLTVGVEEEYLLLDPATGVPLARAARVAQAAGQQRALGGHEVQRELLQAQLEVATPVCHGLDEVGGHLLRMRHALGEAARQAGCALAAVGAAPLFGVRPVPVTATHRYLAMREDTRQLTDEQLICGMHVHVGVPDRAGGVRMLNGLRPWLALLVALAANSPMWQGRDTGFASWRTVVFGRWPVSGPPPLFADADDYERRTRALIDCGLIRDTGQIYWQLRLSERYPTVEVRVMDVQLRAEEAVMLAGTVRALAQQSLAGRPGERPADRLPAELLSAAVWHSARHGCTGTVLDPVRGRLVPAGEAVDALLDFIGPAIEDTGDARQVAPVLERLLREGNGAVRQRRVLSCFGRSGLIRALTDQTTGA